MLNSGQAKKLAGCSKIPMLGGFGKRGVVRERVLQEKRRRYEIFLACLNCGAWFSSLKVKNCLFSC